MARWGLRSDAPVATRAQQPQWRAGARDQAPRTSPRRGANNEYPSQKPLMSPCAKELPRAKCSPPRRRACPYSVEYGRPVLAHRFPPLPLLLPPSSCLPSIFWARCSRWPRGAAPCLRAPPMPL
eukprot:9474864-Pyramimonas_sp.AAC.1